MGVGEESDGPRPGLVPGMMSLLSLSFFQRTAIRIFCPEMSPSYLAEAETTDLTKAQERVGGM